MTQEEFFFDGDEDYDRMFAAGLQQTLEAEEIQDAKEHALEYKRECEALSSRIDELQKTHAMELVRIRAACQTALVSHREEQDPQAHKDVAKVLSTESDSEPSIAIADIVELAKERLTKNGAIEISTLLFHLAGEKDILTNEVFKLIDSIIPAVINRENQTFNFNSDIQQLNINPEVNNRHMDK